MALTLGTLALPELIWTDEFAWSAVVRSQEYAVDGSQIIDIGVRQAGRPITLAGSQDGGWISRADLLLLEALANQPTSVFTLTMADGRQFSVAFTGDGVMADPVVAFSDPDGATWYVPVLKLIEV